MSGGVGDLDLDDESGVARVTVESTDEGADDVSLEKSVPVDGDQFNVSLDISTLPAENYKLNVAIEKSGEILVEESLDFQKTKIPEWLGNDFGVDAKNVPYPFEPVTRTGDQLGVWGRRYDLTESLLPIQITTQGMDLLRGPIKLTLTMSDGTEVDGSALKATRQWDPSPTVKRHHRGPFGKLEWTTLNVSPDVRRQGTAEATTGDGVTIRNHCWFEYDGLLWSEIDVAGTDSNLTVERAVLEIPVSKAFSDVINPGDYSWRTVGAIPSDGFTTRLGHPVWIGNGYGGLVANVEKPLGKLKDSSRAFSVAKGPDGATIRVVVLDQPTPLDQLRTLTFSLQATPVKARRPDYRLLTVNPHNPTLGFNIGRYAGSGQFVPASVKKRYFPMVGEKTWDLSEEPGWSAARDWPEFLRMKRDYRSTYLTTAKVNIQTPDGQAFKDEWKAGDGRVTPSTRTLTATVASPSYRDYFVGRHEALMKESPFGALYYDSLDPVENKNSKLASIPGTLPTSLGGRDLAKRLYTMVKSRYPGGVVFNHGVVRNNMAHQSFADFRLEGESQWPRYFKGMRDFRVSLNPERYRALLMGHNFGQPCAFDNKTKAVSVAEQRRNGPSLADHMFGMILLHDALGCWHSYMLPKEHVERVKNALDRNQWGPDYLTIPYWEQTVVDMPKNMFATFYVKLAPDAPTPEAIDSASYYYQSFEGPAEKAICVFVNESDFQGELHLTVDWRKLGFADVGQLKVENAVHRFKPVYDDVETGAGGRLENDPAEFAKIADGELLFPITPWNYRMIVIDAPTTERNDSDDKKK